MKKGDEVREKLAPRRSGKVLKAPALPPGSPGESVVFVKWSGGARSWVAIGKLRGLTPRRTPEG
jgi:hypothetical protein